MQDRAYQQQFITEIYNSWSAGNRSVVGVMPTGGGKTFCFSKIAAGMQSPGVVFAHRDVLLEQISLALASQGVKHSLLCSDKTRTTIREAHYDNLGQFYFNRKAAITVAGVDTVYARLDKGVIQPLADRSRWWIMDEAHHVLQENKWGKVLSLFGHCYGLGVTATPVRADKKGLGADNDGIFHDLVTSVTTRELIDAGYLSDYEIITSPLARQIKERFKNVTVTATGDYSAKQSKPIVDSRTVIGDVVATYLQHAPGKRGITFGFDIEHCEHLAEAYRQAGVAAVAISSKTKDAKRKLYIKQFRAGQLQQLVNCDLFGEGFDVPAVEVVSMCRATMSYSLFMQQFGRALRKFEGKHKALIIDHVGNYLEHGLPDYGLSWSLDRPTKRKRSNATESEIKLTTCTNELCLRVFELPASHCPYCETPLIKSFVAEIKYVDGELQPLTGAELSELRRAALARIKDPQTIANQMKQAGKTAAFAHIVATNHRKTYDAQLRLRETMTAWAIKMQQDGLTARQAKEQFAMLFGVDPLTAQTLRYSDAEKLRERVESV